MTLRAIIVRLLFVLAICFISTNAATWQKASGSGSGTSSGGTQPTIGLISYHAFELNANDSKDSMYNGTASNIGYGDGKTGNGRCMTTAGNTNSFVSIPNTLLLGRSSITLSTSASGDIRIYMDGGKIGARGSSWRYFVTGYNWPIYIGMHPYNSGPLTPPVALDELRVYNYQMSDAEVLALYQSYLQ